MTNTNRSVHRWLSASALGVVAVLLGACATGNLAVSTAEVPDLERRIAENPNDAEAMVRYGEARAAVAIDLGEDQGPLIEDLLETIRERRGEASSLPALDRADLEDEIEAWLDDHEVDRSWELAAGLVDAGVTLDQLSNLADRVDGLTLLGVIGLIGAAQDQLALVHQIEEGTRRMSAIVKALKSYAYLDQAPVQNVDVTVGLDDTLVLLEYKTKDIEVRREYADALPKIEALGGELNQVWTNLIDNAVYAIAESDMTDGRLVVRVTPAEAGVVVEIQVAALIKEGKTTKDIANMLNKSPHAINFHRNNIRKKIGLQNKKTNLRSYLLSFE